jgi:hypothetical protein
MVELAAYLMGLEEGEASESPSRARIVGWINLAISISTQLLHSNIYLHVT